MMTEGVSRPLVRRTYGSSVPRVRPSTSLIFDAPVLSANPRSSSPPSSSALQTPPPPQDEQALFLPMPDSPPSSPLLHRTLVAPLPVKQTKVVQSSLKGFFEPAPTRKRPLEPAHIVEAPLVRSVSLSEAGQSVQGESSTAKARPLAQARLTHLPLLYTCKECQMSFVRGSEDEPVHQKHHARVTRGIPWTGFGRGQDKGKGRAEADGKGWKLLREVEFGRDRKLKGKIVVCDGSWAGVKLKDVLATVDTVLSAPALSSPIMDACKIFLLITSEPPPLSAKRPKPSDRDSAKGAKERIVAVVVSQGIKTALRVLRDGEALSDRNHIVDSGGGVICDPEPLPTGLGIHRLFTVPSYRDLGFAWSLLDAAARRTVYGCVFDPTKGEVAFSQPTESGRAVMERWGQGSVRVFVDDERQL